MIKRQRESPVVAHPTWGFPRATQPSVNRSDDDDDDDNGDDQRVDRQLVRMGYRFLVRGCKGL